MLISLPKRDKIYSKALGNENLKIEKRSEKKKKATSVWEKYKSYQFLIHSDDFKINENKLTLKVKMLNENVDINTCS